MKCLLRQCEDHHLDRKHLRKSLSLVATVAPLLGHARNKLASETKCKGELRLQLRGPASVNTVLNS